MRLIPAIEGQVPPQNCAVWGGRMSRQCGLYAPVCDNRKARTNKETPMGNALICHAQ